MKLVPVYKPKLARTQSGYKQAQVSTLQYSLFNVIIDFQNCRFLYRKGIEMITKTSKRGSFNCTSKQNQADSLSHYIIRIKAKFLKNDHKI